MHVLNDIWVNWFEGEDKGYNVCPFFEWRKRDKIELVDVMPILYIDKNLCHYIENGLDDLPKKLLAMIQNRTIVKGRPVEYGAVALMAKESLSLTQWVIKFHSKKAG